MKYLGFLALLFFSTTAQAEPVDYAGILHSATSVMHEMLDSPDEEIPSGLISKAKAIIIFPTMLKGGFMIAARYGRGVVTSRSETTGEWSPPSFMTTVGGSFGLQIGGEAVDLILLVMTQRGIDGLLQDKFTLGGDMAVAAGPVGRHAEASTDIMMQGEIYSYSRSKGAFAGMSLNGTIIATDNDSNKNYYGSPYTPTDILFDRKVNKYPETAGRFIKEINRMAPPQRAPSR